MQGNGLLLGARVPGTGGGGVGVGVGLVACWLEAA
jgi:hypothetical protein